MLILERTLRRRAQRQRGRPVSRLSSDTTHAPLIWASPQPAASDDVPGFGHADGGKRRRPAGREADRALFLDFDGVLHPAVEGSPATGIVVPTPLFGWLPALARELEPHPDVVVVVHSTWRYTHDLEELRELLGGLGERVAGTTPRGPRYESILWWLHMNPRFISHRILDDAQNEFPQPPPAELILCDPETGVAAADVQAALRSWLRS